MLSSGPSMLLSPPPPNVSFRFAHFSNTYIQATSEILAFSGFVLRHTLISMFVEFFLDSVSIILLRITIKRGKFGQMLLSEHLFSWPVQRLSLLMSILFYFIFSSVPQNKVVEIRGEKIGVGRLARAASLWAPQPFS